MYLNIVFLPFFGSLVSGFFGRFLGKRGCGTVTIFCVGVSFILSGIAFYEVGLAGSSTYLYLMPWLESDFFQVDWAFCFDSLTVVMLIVVTFISTLVHIYSTEYMEHDPHLPRFMSYLSLFTFFMLILVTSDNFVQMFVGWEGVGLCSYLLINFWFTRIQANKAAIKAMLVNRVGDFGLALGIFGIFLCFGAVDYATVFALAPQLSIATLHFLIFEVDALNMIGVLLFIGAIGKSAQLGLHTWLPDAMEGPTPVSALIHAATMVTAGVFLLARCSPLLEYCQKTLFIVSLIGGTTAFFAATTALAQNDLKRVIAYSTCSQLGYMVFACGLSNYSVAVFHLANHAFFKALLFLGAGSVIHAVGDEQDMRKMGGLRYLLPFTYSMMVIGSLSLMGMPFLTGFFSKDVILEVGYATYSVVSHLAYFLGSFAAFCTAFYSIRLLALCFLSEPNGNRALTFSASESGFSMCFVLGLLAVPSMFVGYFSRDLFIGIGTDFWGNALFCLPANLSLIDAEFMAAKAKIIPLLFSLTGGFLSFLLYRNYSKNIFILKTSLLGRKFYTFFNRKWLFDKIYNETMTKNLLDFGYHFTYKSIDRGLIESLGPFGLSNLLMDQVDKFRNLHSGYLYHYLVFLGWSNIIFGLFFVFNLKVVQKQALLLFLILWLIL